MAHGKVSRKKNREKRLNQKRAARSANAAVYAERIRLGRNTKSHRVRLQAKRSRKVRKVSHSAGPCGNIGCARCHPDMRGSLP